MRWCVSIGAVFVAGALLGGDATSVAATGLRPQLAQNKPEPVVDVELVLAVDVSYSMDMDELAIQREGYAQAIVSKEFLAALKTGMHGKIAVTYFEWAAASDQKVIIPWRVIDISGDGPNNNGGPVTIARDAAVEKGIIINGLPIMAKELSYSTMDIENLDWYYEDCVIGGPGAFVVPIKERDKFKEAIRTKLVMEVAGIALPYAKIIPAAAREPRVNCMVGEKIWQDRWGR
jgi:hypothetical protein